MYDSAAAAYGIGARWFDPQRGRWLSREPLGLDGPNLYHFVFNDPVNLHDLDGLAAEEDPIEEVREEQEEIIEVLERAHEMERISRRDPSLSPQIVPYGYSGGYSRPLTENEYEIIYGPNGILQGGSFFGPQSNNLRFEAYPECSESEISSEFQRHHIFPRRRDLAERFKNNGIEIDEYTMDVETGLHKEIHRGARGGPWNDAWEAFFKANPNPSQIDIFLEAGKMIYEFGLPGAPITPYRP